MASGAWATGVRPGRGGGGGTCPPAVPAPPGPRAGCSGRSACRWSDRGRGPSPPCQPGPEPRRQVLHPGGAGWAQCPVGGPQDKGLPRGPSTGNLRTGGPLVVRHRGAVRAGAVLSRPAGLGSAREGWLWDEDQESEWLSVCARVCQELRDAGGSSLAGSQCGAGEHRSRLAAGPDGRLGARRARSCQQQSSRLAPAARAARGQLACASGNGRGEQISNFRTGVRVG